MLRRSTSRAAVILFLPIMFGHVQAKADITGFNNGVGFTLNSNGTGGPAVSGNVLTLTDNVGNEARSAFYDTAQNVQTFNAQFTYQASGAARADGVTFVLQDSPSGTNALGGQGSGLGYSGITNSVAVELNIYPLYTIGTFLGTNGQTGGYSYNPTGPVSLASGDPIQINLTYDGTTLTESFLDLTTSQSYSTSYVVNIAGIVGSNTAFVGFTGATGGSWSTQTVSGFSFTQAVPEPNSLMLLGLGAIGAAGLKLLAKRNALKGASPNKMQ